MNVKKIFIISIISIVIVFYVGFIISSGTTGHLKFYDFIGSKQNIEFELKRVISANNYSPPKSWNDYELGADSIRDIYVLFESDPKEIYQLGFKGDSTSWQRNKCTLALIGVFDGQLWHFKKDLSSKEIARIESRFENEILHKMILKPTNLP